MISNLIAFFISQRLQPEPIYEALARQDGIHLPTSEARAQRSRMRVTAAMRSAFETLSPQMGIGDALERTRESALDAWPVTDDAGLSGMIERSELERAIASGRGDQSLEVLLREHPSPHRADAAGLPHVHPDHSLTLALERMGTLRYNVLPVVSRTNIRQLLGVVTLHDILEAYGVARTSRVRGQHDRP